MARSVDYTKTLSEEIRQQIRNMYAFSTPFPEIEKATGLTRAIIVKFLMQAGIYVFRETRSHTEMTVERRRSYYSIEKVKYETDVLYKLHELSGDELLLFKSKEHEELKKINYKTI